MRLVPHAGEVGSYWETSTEGYSRRMKKDDLQTELVDLGNLDEVSANWLKKRKPKTEPEVIETAQDDQESDLGRE